MEYTDLCNNQIEKMIEYQKKILIYFSNDEKYIEIIDISKEIINILNYFILCPSRSAKHNRLKLIKRYYELRKFKAHLASKYSILGKA